MKIGSWVRRKGGKWHEVESVIDGDAVTQCGRRMDRVNRAGELQVSEVMPLTRMIGQPQNCRYCDQPVPVTEDDGSTHPDDTP
jgi:hypothetical protein